MKYNIVYYPPELYHHGVKGMKWGIRRFQNYDGTRIKNRKNAQREYEEHIKKYEGKSWADKNARVNVKSEHDEHFTEMYRYQDHFVETNKKERIGYHVVYDMLNKTAVGEKQFVKVSNDGLGETNLKVEKLLESDYREAEKYLSNRVVTRNTGNSERKQSVYKAKSRWDDSLKKRNDAVGKFWADVERDPKVRHNPLRNLELDSNSRKANKAYEALEKEYSKLHYDDMDKSMIDIGKKYGLNRR